MEVCFEMSSKPDTTSGLGSSPAPKESNALVASSRTVPGLDDWRTVTSSILLDVSCVLDGESQLY